MRRLFAVLAVFALFSGAQAQFGTTPAVSPRPGTSWHRFAEHSGIGSAAFELITKDSTYTHLAANDTIEVVGGAVADTVRLRLYGVLASDSSYSSDTVRVMGTDVRKSTKRFLAYEFAKVDSPMAVQSPGTAITIRRYTGDTHLDFLFPGDMATYAAQKFADRPIVLTAWQVGATSTTGAVTFELRYYPDVRDTRDQGDDFYVLDRAFVPAGTTNPVYIPLNNVTVPRGWVAVFGKGSADGADGTAHIWGHEQ